MLPRLPHVRLISRLAVFLLIALFGSALPVQAQNDGVVQRHYPGCAERCPPRRRVDAPQHRYGRRAIDGQRRRRPMRASRVCSPAHMS